MNLEQVPGGGRVRGLAGIPLLTLGAELARERNGLDLGFLLETADPLLGRTG